MASSRTDNFALTANGQMVECRIVYPYLAKKREKDWQNKPIEPKDQWYECTILIPKRPDDLLQAPYVGPKDLVPKVWQAWVGQPGVNGQWKQGARWPVLDCDIVNPATGGGRPETEPYVKEHPWAAGHWRISASSNFPVRVFDQSNQDIQKDLYGEFLAFKGGDYAAVSIHAWAYSTGSGGVGFGLEAVKKTRDGESIGGGQRTPEQIFGGSAPTMQQPALPQGFQQGPGYAPTPAPSVQSFQPTAPAPAYYATQPVGVTASPYNGAPVFGGASPAPAPQFAGGGMPPAPPPPFGTR